MAGEPSAPGGDGQGAPGQDPVEELVARFTALASWEERYRFLIEAGKGLAPYPAKFRVPGFEVRGCQSRVWLHPSMEGGNVVFRGDSDAAIVRGIMAVLFVAYSGRPPKEVLATRPDFIGRMGLDQHLSMSRANGLGAMVRQMGLYALALSGRPGDDGGAPRP